MAQPKTVKLPDDPAPEELVPAEDQAVTEDAPGEDDSAMMGALAEATAVAPADSADALLDMFTTVGVHVEDRSMLLGLAGEVEMDDLISELNIVAAALGIVQAQRAAEAQPQQLAA